MKNIYNTCMVRRKIQVPKSIVGNYCYYIGKIKGLSRIVYYEGNIINDLGDTVECKMIDRHIDGRKDMFIIILEKSKLKFN